MMAFTKLLRRTTAILGAIAALTVTGVATAQTVTLAGTTGNTCSYSSMTVNPNGTVSVTCSGSTTATFSLTAPQSLPQNTPTTSQVRINRAGSSASDVNVDFNVTGNCTTAAVTPFLFPAGTLAFQPLVVTTGPAGTQCMISIAPQTGGVAGSPSAVNIDVVDPDADVVFAFQTTTTSASVNGGPVPIVVTRSGGTNGTFNVPVTLSGSLTTGGALMVGAGALTPAILTFGPGVSSQTFTYTPPITNLGSPAPPWNVTLSLNTATRVPAATQVGTASGSNTISLAAFSASCNGAVNPLGLPFGVAQGARVQMASGQIYTFQVPDVGSRYSSGVFKLSETTISFPAHDSQGNPDGSFWNREVQISKCKGAITPPPPGVNDTCYMANTTTQASRVWASRLVSTNFATVAAVQAANACWADATQGPWYINIRYTYSSCGGLVCGWNASWYDNK